MSRIILLDTGPLGMVSHPRPNRAVVDWVREILQSESEIYIPEIANYEVRRELLRAGKTKGIKRLDELKAKTNVINEVRILGTMIGVDLAAEGAPIVKACLERKLLINCTHNTILRLLPALNISEEQVHEGCDILSDAILKLSTT